MTERPMWDAGPGEHPDEGTIHAWLDDALDAASAERVAAHVQECAACSALAAEARGLIAGASRVVSALDDVPVGSRPGWAQDAAAAETGGAPQAGARPIADSSLWRRLRVTPTRAAIAATILIALGVTLTHDRVAVESGRPATMLPTGHLDPRAPTSGEEPGVAVTSPAEARPKDALLDSAVARNLAIAQGSRRIEAAPGPTIPQAPPPSASPAADAPVTTAEQRVAEGRSTVRAQRETVGAQADRLRVRGEAAGASARNADEAIASAPARAERAITGAAAGSSAAKVSQYFDAGSRACFRVESPQSGAMWGDQPLPLVVAVDSGPAVGTRSATARSEASGAAMRVTWTRSARDSVVLTLQRVGPTGAIAFGPGGGERVGMAVAPSAAAAVGARVAPAVRVTLRPIPCPSH
jgi:hypothetical protein